MTAFHIQDIKDFMTKLLIKETFDEFLLSELSVTTGINYTIDGLLHPEFYDAEEAQSIRESSRTHIFWEDVRPYCFSIIKGKKTPLCFKIIFLLSPSGKEALLKTSGLKISASDILGLYLNCQYDSGKLMLVTGTSLRFFSLDKSLDHLWDSAVRIFLKEQEVAFEEI